MNDGSWHTVCHTCEDEDISSSYEEAVEFFDYHADQSHEVRMTNREVVDRWE